jgi:hypothetical protein
VHGWLGIELEMGYLRQSLKRQSGAKGHQVMIYSDVANVGRTWDGGAAGGLRLAQEMEPVVDKIHKRRRLHRLQVFGFLCRWYGIPWVACIYSPCANYNPI